MKNASSNRLASIDVLRGLDLFVLVFLQPILLFLSYGTPEDSWLRSLCFNVFRHVEWEGFHLWDQVMPLFLFISGASIPFALSRFKRKEVTTRSQIYRIVKRVILLWVFGAIVQGNLLALDYNQLYLYTDTLQCIATGYFFATILYMFTSIKTIVVVTFLLPCLYTLGMFLYGGGYEQGLNLAEQIDFKVLGRFLYGAKVVDGHVVFADWYHISWIYSSMNFVVTVLTGLLSGYILKEVTDQKLKLKQLLSFGILCLALAGIFYLIGEPIIKRLWTSSMTFLSSGISILLLTLCYYLIDVKMIYQPFAWLKIYGLNSILAYMMYNTMNLKSFTHYWLYGLQQYVGDYYPATQEIAKVSIIFIILYFCNKYRCYFKV